jgi:hypothetical protein
VVLLHSKTSHPPSLKIASLHAARKNSLDPCTATYQNIIITHVIIDAINIWWQAPKAPEINTIATQYYTQTPNRENNLQ